MTPVAKRRPYLYRVLIGLDIALGAIGGARAHQTISAQAHEVAQFKDRGHWKVKAINWLFSDDKHCQKSYSRWWNGARYATGTHHG